MAPQENLDQLDQLDRLALMATLVALARLATPVCLATMPSKYFSRFRQSVYFKYTDYVHKRHFLKL
jgi:hypothetical protein